jgi:hypothetical protein
MPYRYNVFTKEFDFYQTVMTKNTIGEIYITGDKNTDGSKRLLIEEEDPYRIVVQERIDGVWVLTSLKLGPSSVHLGPRTAVTIAGHHLMTRDSDDQYHFYAHSAFNGETTDSSAKIVEAYQYIPRSVVVPDDTGEWTGQIYSYYISPSLDYRMLKKAYYKTGSIAATSPVRVQVWEGTDETGAISFDQTYPSSIFVANSEITITAEGFVEFREGANYYVKMSSDSPFSLRTTFDLSKPWTAGDAVLLREEDILQILQWKSGNLYTINQWVVYNKKIYVCNTTGIQTGTFLDNLIKWEILGEPRIRIGSIVVGGNTSATPITLASTFYDLNLNGLATETSENNLWTLINTTTGELRYDDIVQCNFRLIGLVAASSSGGVQRYNFRLLKNDLPLPSPNNIDIPIEVKSTIQSTPLMWNIEANLNDRFRLQVECAVPPANNIVIDTLKIMIIS